MNFSAIRYRAGRAIVDAASTLWYALGAPIGGPIDWATDKIVDLGIWVQG